MKKLFYGNVDSIVISDNAGAVFNFAVGCLGQYFFCDMFEDMFSDDPFIVAQSFVDHYADFYIEDC